MSHYRDPRPAFEAYCREQERDRERRAAADLRPPHVICAEILARHPDTRSDAEIAAGQAALKAYCDANPITAEERAYDAAQERDRLRAIAAPARARRAKVKAKATAKRRAKEQAAKSWLKRDKAFAALNPRFHAFLERYGVRGRRG